MLVRADPDTKSISMMSFPRDLFVADPLPGQAAFGARINNAYATCGTKGTLETVRKLTGPARQLPDHGQLPRLPPARRRGRRHLDGRRPALLQRPRRRLRLRHDQPLPRLPEARRLPGARFRPLPAHGLRPLPRRAPAAVRARVQGPDQGEHRPVRAAEGDQDDHEERRGRRRRQLGARRQDRARVRPLRLLAAAGPLLPVEDRGARGDGRASTSSRPRRTSRRRCRSSRTRTSSRRRTRPRWR